MFEDHKNFFQLLCAGLKLVLASIVMIAIIYYIISASNFIVNFHFHPTEFKLVLTSILFIYSILLVVTTYKLAKSKKVVAVAVDIEDVKNQFVSIVNHKLRTPLTSISGSLKIILTGLVGEVPETMKDMIHVADNNATRLLESMNDLLDVEKLKEMK